jgi:uncharacterized protein (TIGR04255 family)
VSHTPPYLNDSLRWVAAEIRYPPVDDLVGGASAEFRDDIRDEFPIREEQPQLSLSIGQTGPTAQQVLVHRFVRRDRLMSVTVGRDAIRLEATDYPGWTDFRERLVRVLQALQDRSRPDGVVRVGLRYIDEIRLPDEPNSPSEWQGWVDDRLVAPFTMDNDPPLNNGTIVLQYGEAPGNVTIFRAGPLKEGRAVQLEGPLGTPFKTPAGAFFLLDTDASWADPTGKVPEFATGRIVEVLDELHGSCHRLFEASITDRLRQEILSRPREEVWGT